MWYHFYWGGKRSDTTAYIGSYDKFTVTEFANAVGVDAKHIGIIKNCEPRDYFPDYVDIEEL